MSHPKRKDLFVAWSKAMVEGATIDKPNYSPARSQRTKSQIGSLTNRKKRKRRKRRKTRKND